jgi:hypothetical protein
MLRSELAHLELLAEVDSLVDRLNRWADSAPRWQPAEKCRALVRRLTARAEALRVRIEAPLLVATLGGTGTGKSALINAIVGAEVVQTGRSRPTTTRPTLVARPDLTPEMLGVDPVTVEVVHRDLPALRDLVLVDCPDPDTTEEPLSPLPSPLSPSSNLARLRAILPHCDVLLVTATQQKYRSARVADELAAAAPGAHVVFVQTHADTDADIRDDWRQMLEPAKSLPSPFGRGAGGEGSGGATHIFRIDSLRALADAQANLQPRGEFADLLDLLTRQMAGAAGNRIRRANFLELVADTLEACRSRIDQSLRVCPRTTCGTAALGCEDEPTTAGGGCPTNSKATLGHSLTNVRQLQTAIDEARTALAGQIAAEMHAGLLANRRQWENRLLAQTASRWGLSPFALVLRVYQGVGGLLSGALLYRARTPAQMALWGALEGARTWRKLKQTRQADRGVQQASPSGFDPAELRKAAIIVEGYAGEAGFERGAAQWTTVAAEADAAAAGFVARVSGELDWLVTRLAQRHAGWFTRWRYEILLVAMLGVLLYRLGKNFFYDSWLAEPAAPVYGLSFYASAGFWLVLWCLLLLWMFCRRLRRGLRVQLNQLAAGWQDASAAGDVFARVENECRNVDRYRQELYALQRDVDGLRQQVAGTV